ncbi:F-box domain containing protein [Tanacetum coccineum]
MKDDMLKAQIKAVDILCDLEIIYPPALFDIMIYLVIHLPLEALEGGPIRPRWMFPFERYMKKLKELKKVKWYVLHNSPEIDTYMSSSKVDGVRYVVHSRDERRTTQNSGICSLGPNEEMYYGQLQEILEFKYLLFKSVLFRVKWFDTRNQGRKVKCLVLRNNMTQIDTREDDPDIIHFDNSSDLPLSTSLNDLDNATLHIDGQSTEVDAPPDIIDVVDQDDDITDDEDALPHDLADSDDEDLINVDDDGVEKMSADVARSHGGDGGGEDRPPPHHVPSGCMGCFANRGKGKRKPNLGGRGAGRLNTRDKTRNLSLKEIAVAKGPVPINFEQGDKQTLNPLGPHAAHWSNYIGEVVRSVPLYYPSWEKVPKERKAAIISEIGRRPESITSADWDAQIAFWYDPRNQARATQNRQNQAKSTVVCQHGSRSLLCLRDQMMKSSATSGVPVAEEMLRLQALGSNTPSGVPYTEEEINALARKGKQRGHLPGVGRVLPGRATDVLIPPPPPPPQCTHNSADVEKLKKKNKYLTKQVNLMMKLFRSDDKFSQMLTQYESTPEFGNASGSGGCGDDEMADDEDGGEDEEDEEDGDS